MSQAQKMDAMHKFVKGSTPKTPAAIKMKNDWLKWWNSLTWFQKNVSGPILDVADAFREAYNNTMSGSKISAEFGAVKGPPTYTKPGSQVPDPPGYKRATQAEITKPVLAFARAALSKVNPIGKRQASIISGKSFIAQSEWHFDNHPKGGKGPAFWHPGISIFISANTEDGGDTMAYNAQGHPYAFPTENQGMPKSNNPYT